MKEFKKDAKGRVLDIEHFRTLFKNRMGSPDRVYEVNKEMLDKHRGVLPDELLWYWKEYGASSFHDGLFWLTNPEEYSGLVEEYLKDTVYEGRHDLYVVARSAFGELYLWESKKGNTLTLDAFSNMIFFDAVADRENFQTKEEENYAMNRFIGGMKPKYLDKKDGSGKPLFERALKKFGKVDPHEMYGYKLSTFLGGKESIRNIGKMDLFNHFSIQKQLKDPIISISDTENNTLTWG